MELSIYFNHESVKIKWYSDVTSGLPLNYEYHESRYWVYFCSPLHNHPPEKRLHKRGTLWINKWYVNSENFTNIHNRYFKICKLNFPAICVEYKKIRRKVGQYFAFVKRNVYIPTLQRRKTKFRGIRKQISQLPHNECEAKLDPKFRSFVSVSIFGTLTASLIIVRVDCRRTD